VRVYKPSSSLQAVRCLGSCLVLVKMRTIKSDKSTNWWWSCCMPLYFHCFVMFYFVLFVMKIEADPNVILLRCHGCFVSDRALEQHSSNRKLLCIHLATSVLDFISTADQVSVSLLCVCVFIFHLNFSPLFFPYYFFYRLVCHYTTYI